MSALVSQLNRSTQHFIVEGKDRECRTIGQCVIAVDAVPCPVEKNREALLLLLCACKIRLATTFLRRTNPDPGDGPDGKNDPDRVCDPLDPSQNLLHGVTPGCMALA